MTRKDLPEPAAVVDRIIRERRTSLLVDATEPVTDDLVGELIDAAIWAPNHKRTWPWSFTVLRGDARARFGEALAHAATAAGLSPERIAKLPTKYLRSPVVLLVWVRLDPEEVRRREDRDATAAAVQNVLLAATARGLANYWATLPEPLVAEARRFGGLPEDHDLVALVYLGWPTATTPPPPRPAPEVTWLD